MMNNHHAEGSRRIRALPPIKTSQKDTHISFPSQHHHLDKHSVRRCDKMMMMMMMMCGYLSF
jgi:hypothetical protein